MSWMGSEGPAGRGAPVFRVVFWRLGGIGRSRGDRARFADRHFTFCKEGGGSRGIGLLQGKKTRPREWGGVWGRRRGADLVPPRPRGRRGRRTQPALLRAAGGSAPCTFTLGPRLPGEAPCGAQPISVGERGDRAVNACTGFLLKATQGPSPHTAQERAAYVDAPDFNRLQHLITASMRAPPPHHTVERVSRHISGPGITWKVAKARQVPVAQLLLSDEAGGQAECQLFKNSPFDNADYISLTRALG
uniref:Uncharacterized protein n=1 Tax=Rangifer tarandus platyrhynchus TaxID=3082113 RepID=A0ACB0EMU1_RANTA|nr:unnamed protein product [Rangifer tarandus platyrhynchus]